MVATKEPEQWQRLKEEVTSKGVRYVRVQNDKGKTERKMVAELVLLAFAGTPKPGQVPCHMDRDNGNCRAENLCWAYPKEIKRIQDSHEFRTDLESLSEDDRDRIKRLGKAGTHPTTLANDYEVDLGVILHVLWKL